MPEESGIDENINTNIDRDKWNDAQVLTQVAVDRTGDGSPDAIAVCNPDGTAFNESNGQYSMTSDEIVSTQSFVLYEFGFKAKSISLSNRGTVDTQCIEASFNGTDVHILLCANEYFNWENVGVHRIWLRKTVVQAVPYSLFSY